MAKFVPIPHTADVGITAYGKNLLELFTYAAKGMYSLLVDLKTVQAKESKLIHLKAANIEELLIRWLNELLYWTATEKTVFAKFKVTKVTDRDLYAEIRGEKIEPGKHKFGLEIKAATYHNLKIKHTLKGYEVTIIFDV